MVDSPAVTVAAVPGASPSSASAGRGASARIERSAASASANRRRAGQMRANKTLPSIFPDRAAPRSARRCRGMKRPVASLTNERLRAHRQWRRRPSLPPPRRTKRPRPGGVHPRHRAGSITSTGSLESAYPASPLPPAKDPAERRTASAGALSLAAGRVAAHRRHSVVLAGCGLPRAMRARHHPSTLHPRAPVHAPG